MRLGIDLMGGDIPPRLLFPAIVHAAHKLGSSCSFAVFATSADLENFSRYLSNEHHSLSPSTIQFCPAEEVINMDDEPLRAVRRKTDSSLVKGIAALKAGKIDAFVSCGNTGALIAESTLSLPHMKGVSRPGLLAVLPTEKSHVAILDVGGNVACKAQQLVDYAYLGSVYASVANGIKLPKVALLNIGVEAGKGTEEVRQAYKVLYGLELERQNGADVPFQFFGNIEGREIFRGVCDVVVTDGFSGNIMLKTAEGVAAFIFDALDEMSVVKKDGDSRKAFESMQKQFDYTKHLGAFICGIDALVFKVHGNADAEALLITILGAAECLSNNLLDKMKVLEKE